MPTRALFRATLLVIVTPFLKPFQTTMPRPDATRAPLLEDSTLSTVKLVSGPSA